MNNNEQNLQNSNESRNYPRRKFIRKLASIGAFSFVGGNIVPRIIKANPKTDSPRTPLPNPYISNDGKPLLVVVTGTDFEKMLKVGLETIGGLNKLINDNQNVLIKPNLNAVDIYPAISTAESISILAKEVVGTTSGIVTVGDSGFHPASEVYQHINLESALLNTGAYLTEFSGSYKVRRSTWDALKPDYNVYPLVYFSQIIINIACIKRHFLANMSTAIKNNVGNVAGPRATDSRSYLHNLSGDYFLKEVAEIAGLINPELTIVDARSILIGNGPFSDMTAAQILSDINKLVISGDMIAVDLYCSQLLETYDETFSASQISPTLEQAYNLGLGVKDLTEVEIIEVSTTGIEHNSSTIPSHFELYQNYPNPFNEFTKIEFTIKENNFVTLNVYNSLGRKILTLLDKEISPGEYSVNFNGEGLASGTYFYQLKVGPQILKKSMTLLK